MALTSLDSPSARNYQRAPLPAPSTPWREAEFCVVDVELTGLNPVVHEIISFAVVRVVAGRVRLADTLYRTVRPRRMPEADSIRIHGLREIDLEHAPTFSEVLDELLEALTGRVMVAHVAAIDESFLRAGLRAHGVTLRNPVLDTAALAVELRRRRRLPSSWQTPRLPSRYAESSPGLSDLARTLGLPAHRPHQADGDALTAAQVFLALATHFETLEQPLTLAALQQLNERGLAPQGRSLPRRVAALFGR
ncbi:MAG: exonuclease domain-containing protein [Actinomycetota bacterium]|nr:exonuclease domain-containing protein [Actinomycetota bacterium]